MQTEHELSITKEDIESTLDGMERALQVAQNEEEQVLALAAEAEGQGFENVTPDSTKLPMLTILQAQTPVCLERNKHPSIVAGNIYDNVACVAHERITVIPVMYKQRWIEWVPRDNGGGLVAIHKEFPSSGIRESFGKSRTPDGHDLVDTRIHYVLYLNSEGFYNPAIISMSSTGVGKSQLWISQMQQNRKRVVQSDGRVCEKVLAMYSRHYELSTTLQKNKNGQQWYNWEIRPLVDLPVPLFAFKLAADMYRALLKSDEQEIKESYAQQADETAY